MTSLTTTPTHARPRERLAHSSAPLDLEELVSVIIGTGVVGKPLHAVSSEVASRIRSGARGLQQFLEIPGVGMAKAAALAAALALTPTLERESPQLLSSPDQVYAACADLLDREQEHLVVFYLNVRSKVLNREVVSIGTLTSSIVHPRDVFRPAITQGAAAIVIAHNHPSGDPSPSLADVQVTKQLVQAGSLLNIDLVDHVICGHSSFCSLRQERPELFK